MEHRRSKISKFIDQYGIFFILLAIFFAFTFFTGGVNIKARNIVNILVQTTPVAIIALGVTFVIISGGIDLSLGSVIAAASIVSASLAQTEDASIKVFPSLPAMPFIIPALAGIGIGVIAGAINGFFVTKTKIFPFIATLGMLTSARGFALMFTKGETVSSLHPAYKFIGQGSILSIPTPIWILVAVTILSYIMLSHMKFGRHVYAIGGNIRAAQVSGINTNRNLFAVYVYAGFLAGISGIVITGITNSGQPTAGVLYELDAIASTVIGGTSLNAGIGTIPGALIGSLIIGVIRNGLDLTYVSAYWQQIIRGVIIVVAVIIDVQKNQLRRKSR